MSFKLSQSYAFTLTIRPKWYRLNPETLYDYIYSYIVVKLLTLGKVTVITELTQNYQLHMHGSIQMYIYGQHDLIKIFYDKFRGDKYVGFVHIRVIDNDIKWKEYLEKDLEKFYKSIDRRPILIDQLNIFDEHLKFKYINYDLVDEQ